MKTNESAERVEDHRLHPSPKVWRGGNEFRLKFRVMTPFRLLMMKGFIIDPLASVWRLLMVLFALDFALFYFRIFTVFRYLPFTRETFGIVMAVPFVLWLIERFCNYPIGRLLFGLTLRIHIAPDEVRIRKGFFTETYPRHYRVGFAQAPFRHARTQAYRNSDLFCVVVDDVRRDPVAEIFNRKYLERIVTNANVALLLSSGRADREVDPMKERAWRLRAGG